MLREFAKVVTTYQNKPITTVGTASCHMPDPISLFREYDSRHIRSLFFPRTLEKNIDFTQRDQ
jgi:hypothetical protein